MIAKSYQDPDPHRNQGGSGTLPINVHSENLYFSQVPERWDDKNDNEKAIAA